jgi:hypothetical protein
MTMQSPPSLGTYPLWMGCAACAELNFRLLHGRIFCTDHTTQKRPILAFISKYFTQQSYFGQRSVVTSMLAGACACTAVCTFPSSFSPPTRFEC